MRTSDTLSGRARAIGAAAALAVIATACGSDDDSDDAGRAECEVGEIDGDLAMFNWAEYFDPEDLDRFADEFGINATMSIYESNEAMQAIVGAGGSGFDVIVPSDYMAAIMKESGQLLELDKDAIPDLSNLRDDFTNLAYDPSGSHAVPYQAGTTGLAVDTEVVGDDFPRSWSLVFDPEVSAPYAGAITMLDDPRETLGAALRYLDYSLNTTNADELAEAQQLVSEARDRLAAFDTGSADELLTAGETAIAHGYSGDMFVQFLETDDPDRYEYFVPEEGGARWIDTIAIPVDAPHPCTAHTFINWILDAENGAALANYTYYTTPNAAAESGLDPELLEFLQDPDVLAGGPDSLEIIQNTGEFEINYSDAFTAARN